MNLKDEVTYKQNETQVDSVGCSQMYNTHTHTNCSHIRNSHWV